MPPIYRVDQVGSLLRPPELLEARTAHAAGTISTEELRAVEDSATLANLRIQQAAGVQVFTDGEVRRESWYSNFLDAADGIGVAKSSPSAFWHDADGNLTDVLGTDADMLGAVGKLSLRRRYTGIESAFLKEHSPGPYKITMPSPAVLAPILFVPGNPEYPTFESLQHDVTALVKEELRALAADGTPYIQVDEGFTAMLDPGWADMVRQTGGEPSQALAAAIAVENDCYSVIPRDVTTVGIHICRGNHRSLWAFSGGYEPIAEQVFSELNVDRFLLEYDTDRAGTFAPLRFVPKGKTVVLGLVSTKVPQLETEDDLMARIDEAATVLPIEQLALSPQCGFASTQDGNLITPDDQRRKLELVARVAARVWGA